MLNVASGEKSSLFCVFLTKKIPNVKNVTIYVIDDYFI